MSRIVPRALVVLLTIVCALATLAPTCTAPIYNDPLNPEALICYPPGTPVDVQPVTAGSMVFSCFVTITYYDGCSCSEDYYDMPVAIPPDGQPPMGSIDMLFVANVCMQKAMAELRGIGTENGSVQASCSFSGYWQPGPTEPQGEDV